MSCWQLQYVIVGTVSRSHSKVARYDVRLSKPETNVTGCMYNVSPFQKKIKRHDTLAANISEAMCAQAMLISWDQSLKFSLVTLAQHLWSRLQVLLLDIQRPRCLLEPVEAILKGLELFLWSIELCSNLLGHSLWPSDMILWQPTSVKQCVHRPC